MRLLLVEDAANLAASLHRGLEAAPVHIAGRLAEHRTPGQPPRDRPCRRLLVRLRVRLGLAGRVATADVPAIDGRHHATVAVVGNQGDRRAVEVASVNREAVTMVGMLDTFPAIEPYETGMLDVGDEHCLYWECCGNPHGKPAIYLHGGPGSGCTPGQRRWFDPDIYRAVLFDQRGCGRSRPLASEPDADLGANTTGHLVADIEALRQHLGIERWTVLGMSWGTTLGLAYTQAHVDRVSALVLALVTTTSRREVKWLTSDLGRIFPQEWDRFATAVPDTLRHLPLVDAYATLLFDADPPFARTRRGSGVRGRTPTSPSTPATCPTRAMRTPTSVSGSRVSSHTTGGTQPSSRTANCSATHPP
jgi:pimeloyl-ACP methyl ester carboxylesterase